MDNSLAFAILLSMIHCKCSTRCEIFAWSTEKLRTTSQDGTTADDFLKDKCFPNSEDSGVSVNTGEGMCKQQASINIIPSFQSFDIVHK